MISKLFCLALLLSNLSLAAQTTIVWSDSMVVDATPRPITAPSIALLSDGTPIVTWGVNGDFVNFSSQIWCSRLENGAFTTPVGVVQAPDVPLLYGFGGFDVAISDSQVFVVFEQSAQGIFLARSDDAGLSFGGPSSVQGTVAGGYTLLAAVTVDGTSNPIVSYILYKDNSTNYLVRRSTDGGLSFNDDAVKGNAAAPGDAVCECCNSDLLSSGDSVWLVFRNNNQNLRDIWVSRSSDLAATFNTATDVDATDWQLNVCPIAGPRMARSGDSLVTVWMSGASGKQRVYLSTLHAVTMQAGQQLEFPSPTGPETVQSQTEVAALGDTLGVVFVENSKELVFHYSTKGATNLDSPGTRFAIPDHTLQLPSIAFRNGVFHLVYVDATSGQVLYRQGLVKKTSPTNEPEKDSALDISVFPNPVETGVFWVKSETQELEEISLFDVFGKKILGQKPGVSEAAVPTANIPKGVYFLKLKTLKDELTRLIIVR